MRAASIGSVPQAELRGQRVLVRIDAEDDQTLVDSIPTLALLSRAGARVVIATHCDSLKNDSCLESVRLRLSELLGQALNVVEWKGEAGLLAVSHLAEGEGVLIENLALEPGEKVADDALAHALAGLCDIYCNDAFALSHDVRASTVGIARRATLAVAGFAFERELNMLSVALDSPKPPVISILGGELSKDTLLLAEEIARRSANLFAAGQLSTPFLVAKGSLSHNAVSGDALVTIAERMLSEALDDKRDITTPADFTVVDNRTFQRLSSHESFVLPPPSRNAEQNDIHPDEIICDIGEKTRWSWADQLATAGTIFWHGPVGNSEFEQFAEGTRFLAREFLNRDWPGFHRSVICGRSLVRALRRTDIATERVRHLTLAGRAALHYFAGRPLPGVEVLNEARESERKPVGILVPLDGSPSDLCAVNVAAEMATGDTNVFLLHARPGVDEEQYPDIMLALSKSEVFKRRVQTDGLFSRANAILASRGIVSPDQLAIEGEPSEIILRCALRLGTELIVLAAESANESIARRVIDHAPCAVLLAKQSALPVTARAAIQSSRRVDA